MNDNKIKKISKVGKYYIDLITSYQVEFILLKSVAKMSKI